MPLQTIGSLVAPPACAGCGAHAGRLEPLCAACRSVLRWLPPEPVPLSGLSAWAPLAYDGPARALVRSLKFGGALRVADAMAAQIAANTPRGLLARSALVPVPLHPARARRRGFNQAERLAGALAARVGLPVVDCLVRSGPRRSQVGRGRDARRAAIGEAIRLRREAPCTEGSARLPEAVLVDDVLTTGATLEACARALRASGLPCGRAVTYARTPGR